MTPNVCPACGALLSEEGHGPNCDRPTRECEDCTAPATTLLEIHDSAALSTGQVWHEALKCDGHRDELVQQIRDEAEEALGLTIDHMTPLNDPLPADMLERIVTRTHNAAGY